MLVPKARTVPACDSVGYTIVSRQDECVVITACCSISTGCRVWGWVSRVSTNWRKWRHVSRHFPLLLMLLVTVGASKWIVSFPLFCDLYRYHLRRSELRLQGLYCLLHLLPLQLSRCWPVATPYFSFAAWYFRSSTNTEQCYRLYSAFWMSATSLMCAHGTLVW